MRTIWFCIKVACAIVWGMPWMVLAIACFLSIVGIPLGMALSYVACRPLLRLVKGRIEEGIDEIPTDGIPPWFLED